MCRLYGLVWSERKNNCDTLLTTRQFWVIFLPSSSFISILSVFLFRVYLTICDSRARCIGDMCVPRSIGDIHMYIGVSVIRVRQIASI